MIQLRAAIRKPSRRTVVLALLGFLAATILLAHSAAGMGHNSEGDQGMEDAMAVCLAIVGAAGAMALLLGGSFGVVGRRFVSNARFASPAMPAPPQPAPIARAGPAALQVFRL